ncbi:hypothetical protein [Streptomyces sp. AP-93]|uniref:hypothetical protein n=1 Tax=Streptomyces sp. AP-93 TaxID=2929048 RepID=UPI001FAEF7BC|nr:hypothetical protein [Streptomyces sp. AP-93]MCJ0870108.1 hypothetical protein [Streptomyces sp. AP-93]
MSATGAAGESPRPSAVSMGALLAAGAAASAVSTPPAHEDAPEPRPVREGAEGEEAEGSEQAAPESEAA